MSGVLDDGTSDQQGLDPYDEPYEPVAPHRISRARQVTGIVAALAMLAIPLWNVINTRTPQVAHNGLEVCAFDYCVVQEAMTEIGLGVTMAGLSRIVVADRDVQGVADSLGAVVDAPRVDVVVVDSISGGVGGRYLRSQRRIELERPATLWVIAHEVAHTVSNGHDDEFLEALVELAVSMDPGS